jgi:hypothetical protein
MHGPNLAGKAEVAGAGNCDIAFMAADEGNGTRMEQGGEGAGLIVFQN